MSYAIDFRTRRSELAIELLRDPVDKVGRHRGRGERGSQQLLDPPLAGLIFELFMSCIHTDTKSLAVDRLG